LIGRGLFSQAQAAYIVDVSLDVSLLPPISLIKAQPARAVSKVCSDQIVRAPVAAAVDLGSGGTDQVTIAVKRVQKARFIVAGIWLKPLQRAFFYKKRRLNSAVVSPKSHSAPRAIIRATVIWKLNHP
jgi:hypothetical protein